MTEVYVVQGEHPHFPYFPLEVFANEEGAAARCVELTREFLADWWEIHRPDEALRVPVITEENWSELVEKYGDEEDEVQDDGFGRFWVGYDQHKVKP